MRRHIFQKLNTPTMRIAATLIFVLMAMTTFGQNVKYVKGTIIDSKTEKPLENVKMQLVLEDSSTKEV